MSGRTNPASEPDAENGDIVPLLFRPLVGFKAGDKGFILIGDSQPRYLFQQRLQTTGAEFPPGGIVLIGDAIGRQVYEISRMDDFGALGKHPLNLPLAPPDRFPISLYLDEATLALKIERASGSAEVQPRRSRITMQYA